MKSIFASKVFWVAMAQAVVGGLVVFHGAYPDAGYLVMLKSALDIALRIVTEEPVTL